MSQKPAERFRTRLRTLERTQAKIESLLDSGAIAKRDAEVVYEGLFLRGITALEAFLSDLFLALVLGRATYAKARVHRRVEFTSSKVLWDVLLAGRDYLDWLPYSQTLDRAGVFLRGGRPFAELSDREVSKIKDMMRIRNAIAHSSSHSLRVFQEKVIANLSLPPRERTPAGYLRSQARINPPLTRFELILSDLSNISFLLS